MLEASPSAGAFYERRGYTVDPPVRLVVDDAVFEVVPMTNGFEPFT